jgi:hypothetical protein
VGARTGSAVSVNNMSNKPTNLLLASLSAADLKLLEPHLRPLELKQHKLLLF